MNPYINIEYVYGAPDRFQFFPPGWNEETENGSISLIIWILVFLLILVLLITLLLLLVCLMFCVFCSYDIKKKKRERFLKSVLTKVSHLDLENEVVDELLKRTRKKTGGRNTLLAISDVILHLRLDALFLNKTKQEIFAVYR